MLIRSATQLNRAIGRLTARVPFRLELAGESNAVLEMMSSAPQLAP